MSFNIFHLRLGIIAIHDIHNKTWWTVCGANEVEFFCLFFIHKRDNAVFDIFLEHLSSFYPMFSCSASPISFVYWPLAPLGLLCRVLFLLMGAARRTEFRQHSPSIHSVLSSALCPLPSGPALPPHLLLLPCQGCMSLPSTEGPWIQLPLPVLPPPKIRSNQELPYFQIQGLHVRTYSVTMLALCVRSLSSLVWEKPLSLGC